MTRRSRQAPYVLCGSVLLADKLRMVMSSIMRWRRGEIGFIGELLSTGLHERAILADRNCYRRPHSAREDRQTRAITATSENGCLKINILIGATNPRHRLPTAERFSGVLGMLSGLEVKVLYPT
jgi:hypothetical protein